MAKTARLPPGPRPRLGEGRIAGFGAAAIGLLSIGAVLCLRFPGFLTTPELRAHYDLDLLRLILAVAMVAAASLGAATVALGGPRRLGLLGLCAVGLAMLLGGPYTPIVNFAQSRIYLGLDWLVLDLFFTGVVFVAIEALFPRVVPDQPILRQGWRLDLAYFRRQSPADRRVPRHLGAFRARRLRLDDQSLVAGACRGAAGGAALRAGRARGGSRRICLAPRLSRGAGAVAHPCRPSFAAADGLAVRLAPASPGAAGHAVGHSCWDSLRSRSTPI